MKTKQEWLDEFIRRNEECLFCNGVGHKEPYGIDMQAVEVFIYNMLDQIMEDIPEEVGVYIEDQDGIKRKELISSIIKDHKTKFLGLTK